MPFVTRRTAILIGVLWFCFLVKLAFYSSFVPLWEGYDEFSHFAFVQYLADNHTLPDLKNAPLPSEIVDSLRAGPVPWTIRQWGSGWFSHDDYWRGHRPEPTAHPANLRLYEAQQPPLAYLLYAIPCSPFRSASLAARAWIVRIAGSLIASLVIPFGFLLARSVFGNATMALGALAIVASMPELMLTADHGGNEPVAIVLATTCVFALCSRRTCLLGFLLGLGLLTKVYFLTMIPAVTAVYAVQYGRRIARPLLITLATAIAIAGWWYARAIHVTGTLTGTELSAVAAQSTTSLTHAIAQINWLRVADFALVSHIWIGGWSFLGLRAWMYHAVEIIFLGAAIGLALRMARKHIAFPLGVCITSLLCFWAGMAYFAYSTYLATGEAAVLGYYACALAVPEAICLMAGLQTRFTATALVACFAALEIYGAVFLLMPYYAGITAHTARGSVPAARISQIFNGELFRRLAVNKPAFLTPGVMLALFVLFLIAAAGIAAVSVLPAFSERGES